MNITTSITVTSSVRGDIEPISHTANGRRLTIDPHEVSIRTSLWASTLYAAVSGQAIRQRDGEPGAQVRNILLEVPGVPTRGDELPRTEQPAWLRDLVDNALRILDTADREQVLYP